MILRCCNRVTNSFNAINQCKRLPQEMCEKVLASTYFRRKFRSQNFRLYGEMEKQRWEESERRRKEVRRSERRKGEKKEDAGARKGGKVTIH